MTRTSNTDSSARSSKARSKRTTILAEKQPSPDLVRQPPRLPPPPPSPPEARIPLGTVTSDTNANNAVSQLSLPTLFPNKRSNKLSTKAKKKRGSVEAWTIDLLLPNDLGSSAMNTRLDLQIAERVDIGRGDHVRLRFVPRQSSCHGRRHPPLIPHCH